MRVEERKMSALGEVARWERVARARESSGDEGDGDAPKVEEEGEMVLRLAIVVRP